MDQRLQVVGVCCGLSATVIFFASLAHAVANDPTFTLFSSYLSDLGVGPEADVFNTAIVTAGLLMLPFAVLGLWPELRGSLWSIPATAALCLAGAFTVLAGIYTEDSIEVHSDVSMGVFLSMAATGVLAWLALRAHHPLGRRVTELTQAVAILGALLVPMAGHPFFETIMAMAAFIWLPIISVARLRQLLVEPMAPGVRARPPATGPDIPIEITK